MGSFSSQSTQGVRHRVAGRQRGDRAFWSLVGQTGLPIETTSEISVSDSILAERLRIVSEFRADERAYVLEQLGDKLDKRLSRWDPEQVELELSVKERGTPSQKMVLECWIAGQPKMVATSTEGELQAALHDVRQDLFTQIDKHVNKQQDRARR